MQKEFYSKEIEKRMLPVEVCGIEHRDDNGKRVISGYGAIFYDGTAATEYDVWGDGSQLERVMAGSFDRALREDDTRSFFNHEPSMILGRRTAGTARLSVDAKGLKYEIDVANTTAGNDTWESIQRGDVTGASIMFRAVSQWIQDEDQGIWIRNVTEFKPLYEVGPVVFPAYTATTAQSRGGLPEDLRAELEAVKAQRRRAKDVRARHVRGIEVAARAGGFSPVQK